MSISSGLIPGDSPHGRTAPEAFPTGTNISAQEFAAQFRASSHVLWLIAVGIVGDASAAEDVLQDAAIVALRKLDQFQPGTSFRAWVGTIVRNVALNALRSDRRRRNAVADWSDCADSSNRMDDAKAGAVLSIERTLDSRIGTALLGIGDVARACLLLRTVGDLQYSEIAVLLDIPEGTAMSHVHRARAHLREKLAPVWLDHTDSAASEHSNE
jgi:RNA polymerase sigma-70 factor (ECF subfamily)